MGTMMAYLRNDIEHRAFELWESRGRPHGQSLDCWLAAETEYRTCESQILETLATTIPGSVRDGRSVVTPNPIALDELTSFEATKVWKVSFDKRLVVAWSVKLLEAPTMHLANHAIVLTNGRRNLAVDQADCLIWTERTFRDIDFRDDEPLVTKVTVWIEGRCGFHNAELRNPCFLSDGNVTSFDVDLESAHLQPDFFLPLAKASGMRFVVRDTSANGWRSFGGGWLRIPSCGERFLN
jgi:hypothetical protein